jgi:DNA-binding NarL/FixJ family response regulator
LDAILPVVVMGQFASDEHSGLMRYGQAFEVLPPPPDSLPSLIVALHRAVRFRARVLREAQALLRQPQGEPAPSRAKISLTPREAEVLPLVAEGLSNKKIAERLCLSEHTIRNALARTYNKLGAQTRLQAINRAKELNLLG